MKLPTFRGGVHPYDGKSLTKEQNTIPAEPGDKLFYSLSQHIGVPSRPIVQKNDYVLRGQKIALANGNVSAAVHASVSGEVLGIRKMRMPSGSMADCIVVDNDHLMKEVPFQSRKLADLTREEILDRIRDAGIIGMGGAGFPTHVKLAPPNPEKIDSILVNAAECEPYLTGDYQRLKEEPEKIIRGLLVVLKLFPRAKGYLCIEDNKKDCIKTAAPLCSEHKIELKVLRTKYPQGAERMLIYSVTGRKINSSMLPADVGCIVDNVETMVSLGEAVLDGIPVMERTMTIAGDSVTNPENLCVPIGMLYKEVADAVGGFAVESKKIIAGGPMMGNAMLNLEVPVIKTSSALLAFKKDTVSDEKTSACINCGRCVSVCPGRILPTRLALYADRQDKESFLKYHGMECCECGCCSYVCPAKRHLTQSIRSMRKILLAEQKKGKVEISK